MFEIKLTYEHLQTNATEKDPDDDSLYSSNKEYSRIYKFGEIISWGEYV